VDTCQRLAVAENYELILEVSTLVNDWSHDRVIGELVRVIDICQLSVGFPLGVTDTIGPVYIILIYSSHILIVPNRVLFMCILFFKYEMHHIYIFI
jgi:hypothetical protein